MIVFDEYNYALELDNQKIDTTYNIIKKGIVLAKLYFSQGLDEKEVYSKLCRKLIVLDSGGNYEVKQAKINIMISMAKNNPELKRRELSFSEYELKIISSLSTKSLQVFAFVMLCLFKFNDNNRFYINEREVFRLAGLSWSGTDFNSMIDSLYDLGLLTLCVSKPRGAVATKVMYSFTDKILQGNDTALKITDYRNLNYQYFRYFNPSGYMTCQKCGLVVPKKSNSQKFCASCK